MRRYTSSASFATCLSMLWAYCTAGEPPSPIGTSSWTPGRSAMDDAFRKPASNERAINGVLEVYPGNSMYPAELASSGAQGTVVLLLDLGAGGNVKSAQVQVSSRSDVLDANAKSRALTMHYLGRGPPPAKATLRVEYYRDWTWDVADKSCAELNVDIAWFRHAFPGRSERWLPELRMSAGLVRFNAYQRDHGEREPILAALPIAIGSVSDGCARAPDDKVGKVLNRAIHVAIESGAAAPDTQLSAIEAAECADFAACKRGEPVPRSVLRITTDDPVPVMHPFTVDANSPWYPRKLLARGYQGEIELEVEIAADGKVLGTPKAISRKSGMSPLGPAAVAYIRTQNFAELVNGPEPPSLLRLWVDFRKDLPVTLVDKTCSEYNVDLRTWQAGSPKVGVLGLPVWRLTFEQFWSGSDFGVAFGKPGPGSKALGVPAKDVFGVPTDTESQIADEVSAECLRHPRLKFLGVVHEALARRQLTAR